MSKFSPKIYRNVGELSSKYAYDKHGKQFEADIQAHIDRYHDNYNALIRFAKERGIIPSELKKMLLKLIEELDV